MILHCIDYFFTDHLQCDSVIFFGGQQLEEKTVTLSVPVLVRNLGFEGLSKIADGTTLDILHEIETHINQRKLQDIVLEIYGEVELLLTPRSRKILFEYTKKDEAVAICNKLGLAHDPESPWEKLLSINLTLPRKEQLLELFALDTAVLYSDDAVKKQADILRVEPEYALFKHQEVAANKIKTTLLDGERQRVLLHMPTGSGKTRTAMSISCDYIRNQLKNRDSGLVFWFADTEELCQQATEEFQKAWSFLGIGPTNLYNLYGDSSLSLKDIKSGFVIAGLQKLNSAINQEQREFYELGKRTSLLIFDEAHKVLAPTYEHIINIFQTTGKASLIGLSATPGRSTFDPEENKNFASFFNYKKVVLEVEGYDNPIEYLQSEGYLAKTNYIPLPYSPDEVNITDHEAEILGRGDDIPKTILNKLGLDAKRNILILNTAIKACVDGNKIILFACSVKNAEALFSLLKYKDIKVGLITGETESLLRKQTIEDYKHGDIEVLVNYGVLTTGFDAPCTNTTIIARPTNSLTLFSQMVGRATRGLRAGGNAEANIYVINDTLPGFRNMADAFKHWDQAWEE